ncbi:MAG: hypothetical protein J5671_07480 [Bacteroidaceae bacterium]|nr:hypothetical protein [Bacteroidaceae bacterium]
MKKLLLLLFTLLIGVSSSWADETWTSGVASGNVGGQGNYYSNVWYLKLTVPNSPDVFFDSFTLGHASDGSDTSETTYLAFTYSIFASADNHKANEFIAISNNSITGVCSATANEFSYSFTDKVRLNGNETVYVCFVKKNADGTYSLQKRGLAVKKTSDFGSLYIAKSNTYTTTIGGAITTYQCYYTCTYTTTYSYPQASEDNYFLWSGINNADKTSGGKIGAWFMKYTAPGTYDGKLIQFDQFSLSLRNDAIEQYSHLLFCKDLLTGPGVTTDTEFSPSRFAAISTNSVPTANYGKVFTFTFDENSYLECGVTYYIYMGIEKDGNYCLRKYGLYIKTGASDSGFTLNSTDAITCNTESVQNTWQPIYYSSKCTFLDLNSAYANVQTWSGTTLGKYSNPSYTSDEVLAALSDANTNFIASNSNVMLSYRTLLDIADGWTLNMPSAPCFLRIQSTQGSKAYLKGVDSGTLKFTTTKDKETIFLLDETGKLISYSKGLRCKDVNDVAAYDETPDYCTYTIGEAVNQATGKYSIMSEYNDGSVQTYYLRSSGEDDSDAGRNTDNSSYYAQNTFNLEAVESLPVSISSAKYATLSSPVALDVPDGVKAYKGTIEGSALKLTRIDPTIPANTPVVLYAEEADGTTYNFPIHSGAVDAVGENALSGTTAAIARPEQSATATILTLQNGGNGVGFYYFIGETLGGFKAYMSIDTTKMPTSVKGLTFQFEDTDGITTFLNPSVEKVEAIYNIAGQRVSKATRGLYIVNGRKVMVK